MLKESLSASNSAFELEMATRRTKLKAQADPKSTLLVDSAASVKGSLGAECDWTATYERSRKEQEEFSAHSVYTNFMANQPVPQLLREKEVPAAALYQAPPQASRNKTRDSGRFSTFGTSLGLGETFGPRVRRSNDALAYGYEMGGPLSWYAQTGPRVGHLPPPPPPPPPFFMY